MPRRTAAATALALLALARGAAAQETIQLDGMVDARPPDHVRVPFEVPPGTVEIEVAHSDNSPDDILDWGLEDPNGFRGWGGGNEEPAIVGELAASRSYLAGPIPPGTWNVIVGKAKLVSAAPGYAITIILRTEATLAPQPEREPYVESTPLATEERWYAGDLHVHSRESGDASPTIDEVADFAREQGLDFVELSEHNTTSQLDFLVDAQGRHPDVLLLPGVEFTTYDGHANGIGATSFVDHKIGLDGVTIEGAMQAFRDQGAVFSINHPTFDLGDLCIGCAWAHDVPASDIQALEVATAGSSVVFFDSTIALWESLLDAGGRTAIVGGSDDHNAGEDIGSFGAPIGTPTTMISASELSVPALLEGIRAGRTVVKIGGPSDPMVELSSDAPRDGDTVRGGRVVLRATVSGGGDEVRFVRNGMALDAVPVTSDPFVAEAVAEAGGAGPSGDRWRVEVLVDGRVATITSHVFVEYEPVAAPPEPAGDEGCGCALPGRANTERAAALGALAMLVLLLRSSSIRARKPKRSSPPRRSRRR